MSSFHNTLKRIGGLQDSISHLLPNKKTIAGDQKAETAAIAELAITIKAESPELGEKVDQLQKQDKVFRDLQTQQVMIMTSMIVLLFGLLALAPCQLLFKAGLVEKLVSGKIAKQQYIDQVNTLLRCEHQLETFVFGHFLTRVCQENGVSRRKEETLDRINQILKAF